MTEEHINGHSHDRTALILYGSETGNSQDAAEQLGRIAERLRFVTRVVDMDSVEIVRLSETAQAKYYSSYSCM
jgi:sulfite reductase alpha subunit-like flavoprotein